MIPQKHMQYPLVIWQFAMENPPIFKFGKPSISIRAIHTMANC